VELWNARYRLALAAFLAIASLQLFPFVTYAQNLGQQPATGQAVEGQTAAQPEGTVLNLVNWGRQRYLSGRCRTCRGDGRGLVFTRPQRGTLGGHGCGNARHIRTVACDRVLDSNGTAGVVLAGIALRMKQASGHYMRPLLHVYFIWDPVVDRRIAGKPLKPTGQCLQLVGPEMHRAQSYEEQVMPTE
jgi:hypothetical protein